MATVSQVFARHESGDPLIDALLGDPILLNHLGRNTLTYSFSLQGRETSSGSVDLATVNAFNAAQQAFTREALKYVSQVTGIQFAEVADGRQADLHFANGDLRGSATGLTTTKWSYTTQGDQVTSLDVDAFIYLDDRDQAYTNGNPAPGTLGYETLLHEIGHALGLKHPFEGEDRLPASLDNTENTLMSYRKTGGYHSTFSPYDLQALQWLYGGDGLGGAYGAGASGPTVAERPAGSETLRGTPGRDTFRGGVGDDFIDGGAGVDTAVFAGPRASYTVTRTPGGYTVADATGAEGTDTLVNLERLQFADVKVALDTGGADGQVMRLYHSVFDRAPDEAGLDFHVAAMQAGGSLPGIAQNFLASPEFAATYGSLADAGFVQLLYRNVLEREADAGGLAYHLHELAAGASRGAVLAGFSESPEHQAAVVGIQQQGLELLA